jgi:hypothetical protein
VTITPYNVLNDLKDELGIPHADTQDDTLLNKALSGATTAIAEHTGYFAPGFNQDTVATARIFEAKHPSELPVDAFWDPASLVVATGQVGSTFSAVQSTDYEARPLNAPAKGRPYEILRHHWSFWPTWPSVRVQVTAKWGWPAVPDNVVEAHLILSARLFKRKDSPDGTIAGAADFGSIRIGRTDPDVAEMLSHYMKPGFG